MFEQAAEIEMPRQPDIKWPGGGDGGRQGDRSGRRRDRSAARGSVWLKGKQREHRLKPGGSCAQTLHRRLGFGKEPLVSLRSHVLFCTQETTGCHPECLSLQLLVLSAVILL